MIGSGITGCYGWALQASIIAILLGAASPAVADEALLRPVELRCEYQVDPLGLDTPRPRLGWILQSTDPAARGQRQTAFQILVASTPDRLTHDQGDLWDSGRVESDQSNQVAYAGSPLASRGQAYWKVRVWDERGDASGWSDPARWSMGLLEPGDWRAKWIGAATTETTGPLPLFRREFTIDRPLRRAELFICGLGQYELRLNGHRVGDNLLEPGWTNYRKRCLYQAYDLTPQLAQGRNALGVMLGNGMYNVTSNSPFGPRYVKFSGSFGQPELIAQMHLDYADGGHEILASDEGWKTAPGPITFSGIYGGEDHDARLERAGWDRPGFDEANWTAAAIVEGPGGRLAGSSEAAPPIRVAKVLTPVKKTRIRPGLWVYDMGQNCSLVPRLAVRGVAGATVRVTPGELLHEDGTVSQRSSAGPSFISYTLKGGETETWNPRFFYYGSRYLEVDGAEDADQPTTAGLPVLERIEGLFVCGSAASVGEFACSNTLFNRTAELIQWAIRSNMMSLFTDCPHRERLGWLEQAHLMGPSFMYGYDIPGLLTKMNRDMAEAQLDNGLVPDIVPEYTVFKDGFRDSPEWGSACLLVPWNMYLWYGDREAVARHYPMMQRYVTYLGSLASSHILSYGLGDWCDLGPNPPGHAQLTPNALTATAFYYKDVTILEQAARLLGRADDAAQYAALGAQIREAFNREFYHPDQHRYATGSQAANGIALAFGLAPAQDAAAIVEDIVRDVRQHGNGLTAGDVGYRYLLRALTDGGRSDVIFDMNSRADRPGYGYMLERGATSLTEAWDALPALSQNHFMMGHLMEWFYRDLAGIQCDPAAVGFRKVVIKPQPVGDVAWARAAYQSIQGRIASEWKREGGRFTLKITIPPGAMATVFVPAASAESVREGDQPAGQARSVQFLRMEPGVAVYAVGSGSYVFTAEVPVKSGETK